MSELFVYIDAGRQNGIASQIMRRREWDWCLEMRENSGKFYTLYILYNSYTLKNFTALFLHTVSLA